MNETLPRQPELLAVRGAGVLDADSGNLLDPGVIVVRGTEILSIESVPPADARVIDLGDRVLMPGLIDAHTHVMLHGNQTAEEARHQLMEEYPAHRVARAVEALGIALDNGVTTIRELGTEGGGYADVALRDAVAGGYLEGPLIQAAGPALSPTGTYPVLHFRPDWTFPSGVQVADGADECRRAVREQTSYGTEWVKVYANAGGGRQLSDDGYIDSAPNWTAEELGAIVDEAHLRGVKVAAHATSNIGLDMALTAGVDSIEHGYSIRPEAARLMAERGVFLCPTLVAADYVVERHARERGPIWNQILEVHARSFSNCLEAGVKIAFGTDVGDFPWTEVNQAEELIFQERLGMPALDVIRSATTVPAELLGLTGKAGTLRAGATADIIAVPADPRGDLSQLLKVEFVMRAGKIVRRPKSWISDSESDR